ncbi:MAG: Maf family protein [Myxococcota bacterium]
MSEVPRPLILASSSPRRRRLLEDAGFEFEIRAPRIREALREGETPVLLAQRLAREKAHAIAARESEGACVLAADTVVVLDDALLGKPRSGSEAVEMLLRLAGRVHSVWTGWAIVIGGDPRVQAGVVESRVEMRELRPDEAHAYVATGEPLDKAGSYALQGIGGRFVAHVEGSRSNVIGLPLEVVCARLEALGVARSRARHAVG